MADLSKKTELLMLDTITDDNGNRVTFGEAKPQEWVAVTDESVGNFLIAIETTHGTDSSGDEDKCRAILTGVPSPWARVLLTQKAIYADTGKLGDTLWAKCYKMLKSEWRGLIAAYVLRQDRFEFSDPIPLIGRDIKDNYGKMSIFGIYGTMLFNERMLWLYKNDQAEDSEKNPPCIQLLYYKNSVNNENTLIPVAATSPYTFLFSGVEYDGIKCAESVIPWIKNNKFYDPVECPEFNQNIDDMQRLYSFLQKVRENLKNGKENDSSKYYLDFLASICKMNLEDSRETIVSLDRCITEWSEEFRRWQKDVEDCIREFNRQSKNADKKEEPNSNVSLTFDAKPEGPLSLLLNMSSTFYFHQNTFHKDNSDGRIEITSSDIFMDSENIAAWNHCPAIGKDFTKLSAYYVIDDAGNFAFPIPLTEKALSLFAGGNDYLEKIVTGSSDSNIKLSVTVRNGSDDLKFAEIHLLAKLGGNGNFISVCKKNYVMNIIPETEGKVFVWPDFTSSKWNKYYFYNEFPKNSAGIRMIPCFDDDVAGRQLIKYPDNAGVGSHKYEIISTLKPLKKIDIIVNFAGKETSLGTLVVKRSNDENPPEDVISEKDFSTLSKAQVGIDFGSTNTCAYYHKDGDDKSLPIPFTNRRKALVGFDAKKGALASKDELLFISNEGTINPNGQVKSWLHLHNPDYKGDSSISRELVGGVPVNERNILISGINESEIFTNAGTLWYNMKWVSDDAGKQRKQSFMNMLWIQICADMMCDGVYPDTLMWSYPGSMKNTFVSELFEALDYPYENRNHQLKIENHTEAEAVSAYAKANLPQIYNDALCLGIDIGGSTSDIHILRNALGNRTAIASQSSVRLASGFFFKAINASETFRRCLYDFHNDFIKDHPEFYIANIDELLNNDSKIYLRAPYYLNGIFDRLNTVQDCKQFYRHLRDSVRPIFAYPAFVTGVLLYYSGMLVKNVMDKNGITLKTVNVKGYGNGGRLFDWILDIFPDSGKQYYETCFRSGLGKDDVKIVFSEVVRENKSEVAIGLVSDQFTQLDGIDSEEIFDVIGEKGVTNTKQNQTMDDIDVISSDLFDGGVYLDIPLKMENFENFIDIYTKFLTKECIVKNTLTLKTRKDNLQIIRYIQNDPEYIRCMKEYNPENTERSIYRMPIFIASALCYLKEVLLPEVSKQMNDD